MSKVFQNLLEQYKRANQGAKQKLAEKNGFTTKEEYLEYLKDEAFPNAGGVKPKKKPKVKSTIHSVIVLDASGSMTGGKYENSKAGILKEIEQCQANKDSNFTFTLVEFVQKGTTKVHFKLSPNPGEISFNGANGGDTPLYNVVLSTLKDINTLVPKTDKVLFSVFTDGGDNSSERGNRTDTNALIKKLEKENFTVTFVATTQDMAKIVADLSLEESNTLAVTNDALGFQQAFQTRGASVAMYSTSVSLGEDVSKGFYKKIGKL